MEPLFKQEIQQTMYIAGETQDASTQTIKLIEDIIWEQVVHMLKTANDLAGRRGSRVFSNNDLIFQFRHDTARVERLRTFLTWKAIRRTVKDSDDKEGLIDDADMDTGIAGPTDDAPSSSSTARAKFPAVSLPWDISSFFSEQAPDMGQDGLFAQPEGTRMPVESRHVRMAFQRMQARPKKSRALLNATRLPQPSDRVLDCSEVLVNIRISGIDRVP